MVGGRVHRRVHTTAKVAQLVRAEHHPTDGRLAAAEDEVVRTGARQIPGRRDVVYDDRVRRELEIGDDEIDIPEFLK